MTHADLPLEEIERCLAAPWRPLKITQDEIEAAMERGRRFAGEVWAYSQRGVRRGVLL